MAAEKIGLVAGRGNLPFEVATEIKARGQRSVVIGLNGEVAPELSGLADRFYRVEVGNLQEMIDLLKQEMVSELVFAGKVGKEAIFGKGFDPTFQALLKDLPAKNDDAILTALVEEFEKNGLPVATQTNYLKHLLAPLGAIFGNLTPAEESDVELGFRTAKAMGGLDIGQSVVIKKGVVIAVEAIEGTDQAIIRGGQLAGPGAVVVKVSKPNQDERFDVPTVGQQTLESMVTGKRGSIGDRSREDLNYRTGSLFRIGCRSPDQDYCFIPLNYNSDNI